MRNAEKECFIKSIDLECIENEMATMSVASNSVSVFSSPISPLGNRDKPYDYVLKFLLVGDSDVGKEEIIACLDNGCTESPYGFSNGKLNCSLYIIIITLSI